MKGAKWVSRTENVFEVSSWSCHDAYRFNWVLKLCMLGGT